MSDLEPAPHVTPGAGELPPEAFRLIVDSSAHAFAVIDRDGTIRYAGGSMVQVAGWPAAELVGRNMSEFLSPDQLEVAVEALAEMSSVDPYGQGIPIVFALTRPDGSQAWVEVGAMPLLDVPGVEGVVLRHRRWQGQHDTDRVLASLVAGDDLSHVLGLVCTAIAGTVDGAGAAVYLDFDGEAFGASAASGLPAGIVGATGPGTPWAKVAASGSADLTAIEAVGHDLAAVAATNDLQACWCLPVPATEGLPAAVVAIWRHRPGAPLTGHRRSFQRSVRMVQLALQRAAEHARLLHLARHDNLTGVANRTQMHEQLAGALAVGERDLAVAFVDLDGFKSVNDQFGHMAGDAVLVVVADRLRRTIRTHDVLARMGGDEFIALLRDVPDVDTARAVGERLLDATLDPVEVGGRDLKIGMSIGIALAGPEMSADDLVRAADDALYEAKRAGGGTVRVRP